jgi:peptide/nickel transport system ATP-binding protein
MTVPVLSVRDLTVEFATRRADLKALDRVSFDIARGEVLGVVGESGAGKSVTGAAVIGLIDRPGRITGGEVRLGEQRIDNLSPEAMRQVRGKRIGMIFQDPLTSLNPLYSIARQLVETIQTHTDLSPDGARQRAIELLTEVGIPAPERRIDGYPHQFSGGMRQRVVIALALAAEPELVIADEPTTALDVSVQAQIITVIKRMCRDHGTAIMLVTHDMGVIAETADRVAVMYAGRVVEIGPVAAVVGQPLHPLLTGLDGRDPEPRRRGRSPGADPGFDASPQRDPARLLLQPALPAPLCPVPDRSAGAFGPRRPQSSVPPLRPAFCRGGEGVRDMRRDPQGRLPFTLLRGRREGSA